MHLMALVPDVDSLDEGPQPVIKHECRQPPEEDEVEKVIPGTNLFARFKRWIARKRILSPSHFYAQAYLKSRLMIKNSIKLHLQKYPYMIHPFSPMRNFWDLTMITFTFIILILTPIFSTFYFHDPISIIAYVLLFDFIFLCDIIVQFFIGHYDSTVKKVDLEASIVCMNYLKGYFLIDFLTAIPVEIFDLIYYRGQYIAWHWSTYNFIKIFRIRNLIKYFLNLNRSYKLTLQVKKLTKLALILTISIHWSACLVYYVPMVVIKFYPTSGNDEKPWILNESMQMRDTKLKKYILCLNRAIISLVSSEHYLECTTAEDMIMNLTLAIMGKIGHVYLLCQFFHLMSSTHSADKERLRALQQLHEYMQYKELPRVIQKKLLVYCNYWYKKNFNRDSHILAQVSEPFREELIRHNYSRLLETVEMLKYLPQVAITNLLGFIQAEIYLSSDIIVKSGTRGDSMYFVNSGTVAVYTSFGKEICHLEDGSYFGEVSLVMENERRVASVIAIETCEILKISREPFLQIIAPYPNLLSRLQKVAFQQLAKTIPLDEVYKKEDLTPNYVNISNISGMRRD